MRALTACAGAPQSDRLVPHGILARMDYMAFIAQAWKTVAYALANTGVDADLDRHPATLSQRARRRCMAELRRLAVLVRRLIFLMALSVELGPLASREERNYFREEEAAAPRKRSFRVAPAMFGPFPEALRRVAGLSRAGPVDAAPVIARWTALLDALKHHKRRAKCLARTLRRWQAQGEPKPCAPPMVRTYRLSPELGLIANALPMLIDRALQGWPDTG